MIQHSVVRLVRRLYTVMCSTTSSFYVPSVLLAYLIGNNWCCVIAMTTIKVYFHSTVLGNMETLCVSKGSVIPVADWNSQGWDLPAGIEQLLRHSSCCLPKINSSQRSSFLFALTNTRPTGRVLLWLFILFQIITTRANRTGFVRKCRI